MRYVVLDTETSGLRVEEGNRIIELGCVELTNRRASGRQFHRLINPEREIEAGATEVHGFTWTDLQSEPRFAEVMREFLEFVRGAHLLIHNAPFDLGFLDAEFERLGQPSLTTVVDGVTDTLAMARELHPGQRNSLDALCTRYGVSNSHRLKHGALLDAELLAEVWLAMTRGQETLDIRQHYDDEHGPGGRLDLSTLQLPVIEPTPEEWAAHEAVLDDIARVCGGTPIWRQNACASD
jgi:DNA polymerase-3 subunit epsilon